MEWYGAAFGQTVTLELSGSEKLVCVHKERDTGGHPT